MVVWSSPPRHMDCLPYRLGPPGRVGRRIPSRYPRALLMPCGATCADALNANPFRDSNENEVEVAEDTPLPVQPAPPHTHALEPDEESRRSLHKPISEGNIDFIKVKGK